MSSNAGKKEATRLPLGTRWQVKWHLERRQGKKQSLAHPASGAGVRDEIVVDTGERGISAESSSALTVISHVGADRIVGSANVELTQVQPSSAIAYPNVVRSGIFPKWRCRTWR